MKNKRNFSRIDFAASTVVSCDDQGYSGDLLNISLKGALIEFDHDVPLELDKEYTLRIALAASDIVLSFQTKVVHRQDKKFGFTFVGLDLETIIHLRRLLAINLGDDDTITQEFTRL
jgi:c-di-GMP-binding flagellar brake protein YcgR